MLVLCLVIVSTQTWQLSSQGWRSQHDVRSLPLGTLVMKVPSAEVGALVSREASPRVFVHRHTWGYSHVGPCPLMLGGHSGPKAGAATGLARQSTLLADQGPRGWKHPLAWACGSSWALAANSHTSVHIWPERHGNFPMASSGAGAKAQAQDTNLQPGFLGTTPGQALRAC